MYTILPFLEVCKKGEQSFGGYISGMWYSNQVTTD